MVGRATAMAHQWFTKASERFPVARIGAGWDVSAGNPYSSRGLLLSSLFPLLGRGQFDNPGCGQKASGEFEARGSTGAGYWFLDISGRLADKAEGSGVIGQEKEIDCSFSSDTERGRSRPP